MASCCGLIVSDPGARRLKALFKRSAEPRSQVRPHTIVVSRPVSTPSSAPASAPTSASSTTPLPYQSTRFYASAAPVRTPMSTLTPPADRAPRGRHPDALGSHPFRPAHPTPEQQEQRQPGCRPETAAANHLVAARNALVDGLHARVQNNQTQGRRVRTSEIARLDGLWARSRLDGVLCANPGRVTSPYAKRADIVFDKAPWRRAAVFNTDEARQVQRRSVGYRAGKAGASDASDTLRRHQRRDVEDRSRALNEAANWAVVDDPVVVDDDIDDTAIDFIHNTPGTPDDSNHDPSSPSDDPSAPSATHRPISSSCLRALVCPPWTLVTHLAGRVSGFSSLSPTRSQFADSSSSDADYQAFYRTPAYQCALAAHRVNRASW